MKYPNVREEELKNQVARDYFGKYDCTKIIGNLDFCVCLPQKDLTDSEGYLRSLLWAEAKKGSADIYKSIVQLILTIGKARTFDKYLPPTFLGAFDAEKIAFVPYNQIQDVFYQNDFNWNVAPSDYNSKEFADLYQRVKTLIEKTAFLFKFVEDDAELKQFVKNNFVPEKLGLNKVQIDKNNFLFVYNKWLQAVKPTIAVDWEVAKRRGIIDGDFYLADLLSEDNLTIKDKLFVLLKKDHYELDRRIDEAGMFISKRTDFKDNQVAHTQFWNKYERPPKEEYWDYIVERRDLLVPQDVRERKGSFFTPQIWVELSQKYLADVLGENWQDEYYIWDCAAGTGNLLVGLTNKYNIWASTLDQQDVDVMLDRISNGANLLPDHVFQFDFLNDEFLPKSKGGKLPDKLYEIISDPEQRKKLVIYINPPYAESNSKRNTSRSEVQLTEVYKKYFSKLGKVAPELFAQFLIRIYEEIPSCFIAQFSTLKVISASNSETFRKNFLAKNEKAFIVPADTFDNVEGKFPIGFFIWNTQRKEKINQIRTLVYDKHDKLIGEKTFYSFEDERGRINNFLDNCKVRKDEFIGVLVADAPDFQNNHFVCIQNSQSKRHGKYFLINSETLICSVIYFSVRHCIKATWLNDRDQFLYPNDGWQTDKEFQNDCLVFTLFHGQNRISCKHGVNHWIPFTEAEVNAREVFDSHFMTDFIHGKIKTQPSEDIFGHSIQKTAPLEFSPEAKAVFDAGRELWRYYHQQPNCLVNASLYDIKEYFQGRNHKGQLNHRSLDPTYNQLLANLREKLNLLAKKIEPKVYEYGFLRQ